MTPGAGRRRARPNSPEGPPPDGTAATALPDAIALNTAPETAPA